MEIDHKVDDNDARSSGNQTQDSLSTTNISTILITAIQLVTFNND